MLFLVDDMGWIDCGAYGSKYYDTPNIDRFAKQAMRFTDAYACPLCSPTRASLLTGKYSARHGITSATGHQQPQPAEFAFLPEQASSNLPIVTPISKNYLEPKETTLAEALHAAGYRTGHFGKWHLGLTREYWPETQGFDTAWHAHPDPGPPSYFSPYGVTADGEPRGRARVGTITDGPAGEYIVDRVTDEALRFIDNNRDRPFFLNLWQFGVHGPWGHKETLTKLYAERTDPRGKQTNPIMASMLKSVDDSLGRVLDKLTVTGLAERTIVIFMSDNGGNVHSNIPGTAKTAAAENSKSAQLQDWRKWAGNLPPTNNAPLRDGKGTLYEGGVRVPLMVMWPGQIAPGSTSREVVGAVDIYPTVCDLLGLPPAAEQKVDGISLAPVLRGQGPLARQAYFNFFPHGGPSKPPGVTVRSGDFKLIRWFMTGPEQPTVHELYNLRDDLSETKNLAASMPDKLRELDSLIDGFLHKTGALVPKPNPAYRNASATTSSTGAKPATKKPAKAKQSPAKATAAAEPQFDGWRAKNCTAQLSNGRIVVSGTGRAPFLGIAGLKAKGSITLRILAASGAGPGKIQWRTADQAEFPKSGQVVEFALPAGDGKQFVEVAVPAEGELVHLRLYLPAQSQSVALESVELSATAGGSRRWEFDR